MKNIYKIFISYQGYVRTKKDLTGNILFEEEFTINANSEEEALEKIEKNGKTEKTYKYSSFNMDFDEDEIIRDDTEEKITIDLIYFSYKNFIRQFEGSYSFLLNLSKKDIKNIRKEFYKTKNYELREEEIKQEIWFYLDKKYFFPKKIRFNVKELNLNQILPETYFNKTLIIPELTFYENKINSFSDLISLLNNIINDRNIELIPKEINKELSNNAKRKLEKQKESNKKNKLENLIKKHKNEYIKDLKEKLKDAGLEEYENNFYLDIKIK